MTIIRWIVAAPFILIFLAVIVISTIFSVVFGLILYAILGKKIIEAMDRENVTMQIPL